MLNRATLMVGKSAIPAKDKAPAVNRTGFNPY